jgi:2-succinyl-5-enolpyruvyl-6-hydroxy-3-cyclohexene-1-carboxylate synthase
VARVLAQQPRLTDPDVARIVVADVPDGSTVVVSSSMPVRDVEWYSAPRDGVRVLANRGANGIDGVLSTAVGVALAGGPTTALVGDLAFLHDVNGLLGVTGRDVELTIVVVDNDGGGIFSFLPQAEALDRARYERLFGTPHGLDLLPIARAHGIDAYEVMSAEELADGLDHRRPAPRVLVVRTDRRANVAVHHELHAAVAAALT